MKKYSSNSFSRYKKDVKSSQPSEKQWDEYSRDELIVKFLPLVENIARKFKTNDAATGVLSLEDIIQFGTVGLIKAIDRLSMDEVMRSKNKERTLKSFLAKRIRGAIRRSIDSKRSGMRLPEHKLNEIRSDFDDEKKAELFYSSIFESINACYDIDNNDMYQIEDESVGEANIEDLTQLILSVAKDVLSKKELTVLKLSFGLDCDKVSAKEIAKRLNMKGTSAYVRVSIIKKQAINKLKEVIDYEDVVDYLR